MNKELSCGLFLGIVLISTWPLESAVRLEWKLVKGQKFAVESQQSITQELGGQLIDRSTNWNTIWTVNDVSSEGRALIESKIQRIQASVQFANGPTVKFDTDVKEDAVGSAKILANTFGKLVNQSNVFQFSKLGLSTPPAEIDNTDGEKKKTTDQTTTNMGLIFPDRELIKGDSWKTNSSINLPVTGLKTVNEMTYQYDGQQEFEGRNVERIMIRSQLTFQAADNNKTQNIKSQKLVGQMLFDAEKGILVTSRIQAELLLDAEAAEQKINQKITSISEVKMNPIDQSPSEPKEPAAATQ